MSKYLKVVENMRPNKVDKEICTDQSKRKLATATKATEATKVPGSASAWDRLPCDQSDQRPPNFTPLTISEALAEINRRGSGAGKNAELYHRGELSEERAVEYVTCAILHRRRESFRVWRHHAAAVRKALSLCIHELEPKRCKVCNGEVGRLIEEGATL